MSYKILQIEKKSALPTLKLSRIILPILTFCHFLPQIVKETELLRYGMLGGVMMNK